MISAVDLRGCGVSACFGSCAVEAHSRRHDRLRHPRRRPIEDDEVIKVDTEVVNVLFTAQDNNRLLTNLKPDDVKLFENGQQEITAFSRQVDLPLSLAILIDISVSQQRTLPEEKAAAISFLETVVRPTKDEVSVISFTGESTLEQGMTNNLDRLRRAVDACEIHAALGLYRRRRDRRRHASHLRVAIGDVQGSTAIWDAIWVTSDEVLGPAPEKTRRAIILLTDGVQHIRPEETRRCRPGRAEVRGDHLLDRHRRQFLRRRR